MAMVVSTSFLAALATIRQYLRVRDMEVRLNPAWLERLPASSQEYLRSGEKFRLQLQRLSLPYFPIYVSFIVSAAALLQSFKLDPIWFYACALGISLNFLRKFGRITSEMIEELEEDEYTARQYRN
ncbi:MAG TPA: hypothetical protein VEA92_03070 [Candidatus Paceibacterota bacterium]|nr:hypothetical protein [Candidatus Paceibacterota bacterium]